MLDVALGICTVADVAYAALVGVALVVFLEFRCALLQTLGGTARWPRCRGWGV